MGYIVLSEGYAYLYGALLKKPEKYKEDLVLDNFEAFIKYLGRYTLKPHQNVYSYLFDVIGRLHQMARPMVGVDRRSLHFAIHIACTQLATKESTDRQTCHSGCSLEVIGACLNELSNQRW